MRTNRAHILRKRGVTAVLAMLFLVLFSTLAIGFYAATNTASQVASNDDHVARAYAAAESGMDFMRYQLANVSIPPGTASGNVITELYKDLKSQLEGTSNMSGQSVSKSDNTISIPSNPNSTISLD